MSQPFTAITLEPQIIPAGPLILPPQRRILICLMLALAALLHVATSAWGPIGNGPDGMNAAISRELALGMKSADIGQLWSHPVHPTPVQWLTMKSFQIFNVSDWAARLPFAVANLLGVGVVFLIAERLGGIWRGLASGIIAATTSGPILHGRDGGGAALVALAFIVAFYAAVRMLEQKSLARWQVLYWSALLVMLWLQAPVAATLSVVALWLAFARFREARIRLRARWWISGNLVFFIALLIFSIRETGDTSSALSGWRWIDSARFLWVLFPWSIIMLPPCFFRLRKILRLHEITPQEIVLWSHSALFIAWAIVLPSSREWPVHLACLVPIFAILSGLIWDRLNCHNRLIGVALLVLLAIGGIAGFVHLGKIVGKEWLSLLRPIWWLSSGVLIVFGLTALVALHLRHSRAALLIIAASTIPLSYNLLDARARHDWQYTLQGLGNQIDASYLPETRVFLSENIDHVSSFLFYAPHGLQIHPASNLDQLPAGKNYLLVRRDRPPSSSASSWFQASRIGTSREHFLLLSSSK